MCRFALAAAAFFPVIIGYFVISIPGSGNAFVDADEAEGALSSAVQRI